MPVHSHPNSHRGVSRWVKAQQIEHIAADFPADLPVVGGEAHLVQIEVVNHGPNTALGEIHFGAPDGWRWESDSQKYSVAPGKVGTLCVRITSPDDTTGIVRAARDADANQGPMEETAPGTRVASCRTADGYRIQAAIPLREAGVSLNNSRRIGFNIIIYDGDTADAEPGANINKSRIAWAARSGVQGRPEDWGRVDLE